MSQPVAPRPVGRSGIWIGVALMVAAVLVLVAAGVIFWRSLSGDASVVDADGRPHQVTVPADETYGVFLTGSRPATCTILDGGDEADLGPVSGSYEVNQWTADREFETGSGDLTVTCTATTPEAEVRLGPLPSIGGVVGAIFGGLCLAGLLGVGGLALLVVTVVRRSRAVR
ncbi:hypothetical protein [Nocardioides sp. LML1-1-1.1]|uniref:hypothetical protein n=1 Tax=Nocardioides sp. LML1-1-1.1 TaxID=3135248 RepID=UPI00342C5FF3